MSKSTLYTPNPQDKTKKRQREEGYPLVTRSSAKEFKIIYKKKTKRSPKTYLGEEAEQKATIIIKEPLSSTQSGGKFIDFSTASSMSQDHQDPTQTFGIIHGDKEKSIFYKYKEIMLKNENLKGNTYTKFWKQTASAQIRLLSDFDTEKGIIQMAFLQAHIPHPQTTANYKNTSFEFYTKEIHPIDHMKMHKQIGEMIFSTFTNTSMTASKF